jgi:hypothetical protein
VLIVETRAFSRRIDELISLDDYRGLQLALVRQPTVGALIPGGAGIRKLRWAATGRGKRGGVRILYFLHVKTERLLMLYAFAKNERADLSPAQLKTLRRIVETEYP